MLHLEQGRAFFARIRSWMPMFLELSVTLASARMALLLFRDQNYFDKYYSFYAWLLAHFPQEEWKWGTLATAACGFKALGMLSMVWRKSEAVQEAAFVMREIGWGFSVIFWSTFGLSITFGDPWSLGSICCGVMAMLSLGALIMGPAMPSEVEDGSAR